jgi:hypothetical protein
MEQLQLLEMELKLIQENIKRIKEFQKNEDNKKYKPYNSNVVGEFKHRCTSLKQRLTLVSKIVTSDLFE